MNLKLKIKRRSPRQQQQLRDTLDNKLAPYKTLPTSPQRWIRAIRQALGMNGRQLADRLGVSASRVSALEQDEYKGNVTLNSMQKAAEAMGCKFVYAIVPETSLEEIVHDQVVRVAKKRMERVGHTMLLENQEVTDRQADKALQHEIMRLKFSLPKTLWDKK